MDGDQSLHVLAKQGVKREDCLAESWVQVMVQ